MSITKVDYLETGKNIVNTNPFYNTLNLFLKYYFINTLEKEFYLNSFIKDIIKDENEFKVFIVFKEYALHVYHDKYVELFDNINSLDNKIYVLLGYVKISYENDRNIIKPYISSITDNQTDIINKFNYIKSSYMFKEESLDKFKKLKDAITYLEKARYHEEQAKYYNNIALKDLKNIKSYFENSFSQLKYKDDSTKVLSLKL